MTQHTYPPLYPPGSHWAITEAWGILDLLRPGVLTDEVREVLAGAITGTLLRLAQEGHILHGRGRAHDDPRA